MARKAPAADIDEFEVRTIQIDYLARRLIDRAEGHPILLHSRAQARLALRGHITHLAGRLSQEEQTSDGEFTDEQIEEVMGRANHVIAARTRLMQRGWFFLYLAIPVYLFVTCWHWDCGPVCEGLGLDHPLDSTLFFTLVILIAALVCTPPLTWLHKKNDEAFSRDKLRKTRGGNPGPELPRKGWLTWSDLGWGPGAFGRWLFGKKSIHVFTPSYLVALIAFLLAILNIDYKLHADGHEILVSRDYTVRAFGWLDIGKEELALAGLLALIMFVLENVMENLSVTREGLKQASGLASFASDRLKEVYSVIKRTTDVAANQLRIAEFMAIVNRGDELKSWARIIARDIVSPSGQLKEVHQARALDFAGRRLKEFGNSFAYFFAALAEVMQKKVPPQGAVSQINLQDVYDLTVMATAFEAQFNAQKYEFVDNGSEIVAPFEALGGFVAKFIDSLLQREREPDLAAMHHAPQITFYTLLPIPPSRFFTIPRWDKKPSAAVSPKHEKCRTPKADSMANFLMQLREALAAEHGPKIVRHFLVVDEAFIKERLAKYAVEMKLRSEMTPEQLSKIELKEFWNPLAHDAASDLLNKRRVYEELRDLSLVQTADNLGGVFAPEQMWTTSQSTDDDGADGWGLEIVDAKVSKTHGARAKTLLEALQLYHDPDGLRVLKVEAKNWLADANGPDEILGLLLEEERGQYTLVDYFAARMPGDDGKERWLFAIKSSFDPDMGVVKMKLMFDRDSNREWAKQKANLDRLFGLEGESSDHIELMEQFFAEEALKG